MANNVPEFLGAKSCIEQDRDRPNQCAGKEYGQELRAVGR